MKSLRTLCACAHSCTKMGLLAALFCLSVVSVDAQNCTIRTGEVKENNVSNLPTIYDFGGSTFVACKTGTISTLSFKVAATSEAQPNATLFLENGIGNGVVEDGTQTYADYVQAISISGNGASTSITLTTPFPVTKGETYTWYVQKDPDAGALVQAGGASPGNGYEGGATWYNNLYYRDMDNLFSLRIK